METGELKGFLQSLRLRYGYDFTDYAEASLRRRVQHFMTTRAIRGIDVLEQALLRDEKFFEEFIQDFTVTVTDMFRDPAFFSSLRKNVLGRLATYPVIKVWIAGCATGEEIYSVAIVLKEEGLLQRSVLYGTDLNQRSLQVAKDGVYPLERMKAWTTNYQQAGGKRDFSEYYTAKFDAVMLDKSLRQNMVFSPHNLAADKSFNEFQLVLCRNVLIYFNQQLQNRAIHLFYDSLCPFGYLALGNKESLLFSDVQDRFSDIDRREKIFMKKN